MKELFILYAKWNGVTLCRCGHREDEHERHGETVEYRQYVWFTCRRCACHFDMPAYPAYMLGYPA